MDKYEAALRTASAIYHLGANSLSINEESALQNIPEFRERVEDYLKRMKNGERITKPHRSKSIILDKPLMQYGSLINTLCQKYEHIHIGFLCSHIPQTSHFTIFHLSDGNVTYECLNIPINEWDNWKQRSDYQGE